MSTRRAYRLDPAEPGTGVRYEVWDGATRVDAGEIILSRQATEPGWVAISTTGARAFRGRADSIPGLLDLLEGAAASIPHTVPAPPHAPTTAREAAHA